jgi:histidinol-phosphate aminotransferase
VVVTPPVFGMYAVSARLQGARLIEVPLLDDVDDFKADLAAVVASALSQAAKLVFLCSPGNPAGGVLPSAAVIQLAKALEGTALVVVDEAYIEFSGALSLVRSIEAQPNLAVLRTLSKAHALAGARIGCLMASADVIAALRCCQAPYPVPTPSAGLALQAIASDALLVTRHNTSGTCREREALHDALIGLPCVRRVYPSQANFLLVRFNDIAAAMQALLAAGIVVRDMRHMPQLHDALRISIGSPAQNRQVVAALQGLAP